MHSLKCLEKDFGQEMPESLKLPSNAGLDPGNGFSVPSAVCSKSFPAKKKKGKVAGKRRSSSFQSISLDLEDKRAKHHRLTFTECLAFP